MRTLLAAVAILATCPAAAQAPATAAPHAPRIAPGAVFEYRTSRGRTLRMTLGRIEEGRHHWELHDITEAPRLAARIVQDSEFRNLEYEDASGGITRYEPHNCEKVVGMCRYTVRNPDGTASEAMRINGIEAGIWNYSLWNERDGSMKAVAVGEICYDPAGVSLTETWTDLESAGGYAIQRILPDGTLADCTPEAPD